MEFITQVQVWMFQSFTFLYSHNQHALVTFVKVFVNLRCFKGEDHLFMQSVHLRSTRTIITQRTLCVVGSR